MSLVEGRDPLRFPPCPRRLLQFKSIAFFFPTPQIRVSYYCVIWPNPANPSSNPPTSTSFFLFLPFLWRLPICFVAGYHPAASPNRHRITSASQAHLHCSRHFIAYLSWLHVTLPVYLRLCELPCFSRCQPPTSPIHRGADPRVGITGSSHPSPLISTTIFSTTTLISRS